MLAFPENLDLVEGLTPETRRLVITLRENPDEGIRAAVQARAAARRPTDRLSCFAELLGVDAFHNVDADGLSRLSVCSRAFGKAAAGMKRPLCAQAAWRRLHANKGFRHVWTKKMPTEARARSWGSNGFPGWLRVLHDWEWALDFEGRGGFAAFDRMMRGSETNRAAYWADLDKLNKGAFSNRRTKMVLGHMEPRPGGIRSWMSYKESDSE